jgi:hypothetical protein
MYISLEDFESLVDLLCDNGYDLVDVWIAIETYVECKL